MCCQCDEFKKIIDLNIPDEYFRLVTQLRELTLNHVFIVRGDYALNEIEHGKPWPADIIEHFFTCTLCGSRFILTVETYHGRGGCWKPENEGTIA